VNPLLAFVIPFFHFAAPAPTGDLFLPNPRLTPGRVAKRDQDRRDVTLAMEKKVFARYRIPWTRRAEFRIDHLIPPELGGADTIDNLWPHSLRARPYGPDRKQLLTRFLLEKIAQRQMTEAQAQEVIRRDWVDAFVDYLGLVYLQ
jgi:hypothetical protein